MQIQLAVAQKTTWLNSGKTNARERPQLQDCEDARANNLRTLCKRFYRCTIKFSIISNTLTEVTKIKYTCAVLCTILNVVRLPFDVFVTRISTQQSFNYVTGMITWQFKNNKIKFKKENYIGYKSLKKFWTVGKICVTASRTYEKQLIFDVLQRKQKKQSKLTNKKTNKH